MQCPCETTTNALWKNQSMYSLIFRGWNFKGNGYTVLHEYLYSIFYVRINPNGSNFCIEIKSCMLWPFSGCSMNGNCVQVLMYKQAHWTMISLTRVFEGVLLSWNSLCLSSGRLCC